MTYRCTYCDTEAESMDDQIFQICKQHGHEIIFFESNASKKSKGKGQKTRTKGIPKVNGFVYHEYYVESVIIDDKPQFLARQLGNDQIIIKESLELEDKTLRPLNPNECGYFQYNFSTSEVLALTKSPITTESLIEELKKQVDRYIVAKELDKYLIVGDILISYSQERISTVHYPYYVGETESGKSSVLHLGRWLNYRCLYGEDIPDADVYNFLGSDGEGCGVIAEDEAQEITKNREKIRMYKNSYSKGSVKARILMTDSSKQQIFYKTFCPKWFAGEKLPQDKGFQERLAVVYMSEGEPQSNIKRVTDEEKIQLHSIRNKLLIWKLQNIDRQIERVNIGFKGRDEELWSDFVAIAKDTTCYEEFLSVAKFYTNQRHQTIYNSIEAKLFQLLLEKLDTNLSVNFTELWNHITDNNPLMPGTLDQKTGRTFHPAEFPNILTFNNLSKTIEQKFRGIKHQIKKRENGIQHQTTTYSFQKDELFKLARKYGIDIPLDSPLYGGERPEQGQHGNKDDDVHDVKEDLEIR